MRTSMLVFVSVAGQVVAYVASPAAILTWSRGRSPELPTRDTQPFSLGMYSGSEGNRYSERRRHSEGNDPHQDYSPRGMTRQVANGLRSPERGQHNGMRRGPSMESDEYFSDDFRRPSRRHDPEIDTWEIISELLQHVERLEAKIDDLHELQAGGLFAMERMEQSLAKLEFMSERLEVYPEPMSHSRGPLRTGYPPSELGRQHLDGPLANDLKRLEREQQKVDRLAERMADRMEDR